MSLRLLAAVVAASPVAAAPIPEGAKAPPLYFPIRPGAKWVYDRPGGGRETVTVAAAERAGGEWVVERAGEDGTTTAYTKVVVSPAGLRQDQDVFTGRPGAVWLLKTPFRPGDSWPVPESAGGASGPRSGRSRWTCRRGRTWPPGSSTTAPAGAG